MNYLCSNMPVCVFQLLRLTLIQLTVFTSFMIQVPSTLKPVHWCSLQINWFLYDKDFRHERVKQSVTVLLVFLTL